MGCYYPHLRLMPALFKGFFFGRWSICPNDSKFTHSAVMNGVKVLPNLESFHVDLSVSTTYLQLDSLWNIIKIVITGYCINFLTTIIEPLTVAISNSPQLGSGLVIRMSTP